MSNQKSGLRFRIPSWFAPASASNVKSPPRKSSNQSTSTPPPTTQSNDTSSTTVKEASPSDEVQNRNKARNGTTSPALTAAQKTIFKTPGKAAQNSNSQSQTSKTKVDPLPQARKTSQARPDKPASPTQLNPQPSNPPRVASQPKATTVQPTPTPTPTTPPQLPSISEETSPPRSKPKKGSDHELKTADEVVSKSPPQINSPKPGTQLPKSGPISGDELKPTNEVDSKPSSPKKSPEPGTQESSQLPAPIMEENSAIDEEPVAANSTAHANTPSNEIPGQPKKQIPTSQGVHESPIPTPVSDSSNINYQWEKIPESQLKPEVANHATEKAQETKEKEVEKEKNVINELQREESGSKKQIKEQQSMAVQPKHTNSEAEKNVAESTPNSKQNKSPNQPRHKDSNDDSFQEHAKFKGDEFPFSKESTNDKPQLRQIKTKGVEVHSREERPFSVITLAGENRGATMEIGSRSSIRNQGLPIHRGYRLNKAETNESTTDAEENPNKVDSNKQRPIDDNTAEMHINSNLQSINNSIMFNSSITQRDPGVHVVRSQTSVESNKTSDKKNTLAHKADFNITKAQKLTYEPNVRRRCLRGLLLESSDSDQDNPGKSRRHGCRVACNETNQSNKVDIL